MFLVLSHWSLDSILNLTPLPSSPSPPIPETPSLCVWLTFTEGLVAVEGRCGPEQEMISSSPALRNHWAMPHPSTCACPSRGLDLCTPRSPSPGSSRGMWKLLSPDFMGNLNSIFFVSSPDHTGSSSPFRHKEAPRDYFPKQKYSKLCYTHAM